MGAGFSRKRTDVSSLVHIREEQVFAVLVGFVHKGKQYSVDDFGYKVYYHVRYASYPLRHVYVKFRSFAGKIKRKLTGG